MGEEARDAQAPAGARANGSDNGRVSGETVELAALGGPRLSGFLARPNFSAASGAGRNGIVLAHGFPEAGQKAGAPSYGYPQLATRLAVETGAAVLTFEFRGTGASEGDFSLGGWRDDLQAAVQVLRTVPGIEKVWLVGFGAGGALAICVAGEDLAIAGVATFAAPASFDEQVPEARRFVAQVRAAGMIHTRGFPEDPAAWARELKEIQPAQLVGNIPPRPLLIVHGASDDVVPMTDARELADIAYASAELRVLAGAGHRVLHDPRSVALLLGWFDRHLGAAVPTFP